MLKNINDKCKDICKMICIDDKNINVSHRILFKINSQNNRTHKCFSSCINSITIMCVICLINSILKLNEILTFWHARPVPSVILNLKNNRNFCLSRLCLFGPEFIYIWQYAIKFVVTCWMLHTIYFFLK